MITSCQRDQEGLGINKSDNRDRYSSYRWSVDRGWERSPLHRAKDCAHKSKVTVPFQHYPGKVDPITKICEQKIIKLKSIILMDQPTGSGGLGYLRRRTTLRGFVILTALVGCRR